MTSGYRAFLWGFASVTVVLISSVYLFNFTIDPLQFYRVPSIRPPRFYGSYERYVNVALARTQTYDIAIVGSSLAENFLPSHAARYLNAHPMKLAISGSTPHEQRLIVDQALATGQLRRVLWVLEYGGFVSSPDTVRDDQSPFPYYMYRRPAFLNLEYPLSLDTFRLSLASQFGGNGEPDLDKLDVWYDQFAFGPSVVLKQWIGSCQSFQQRDRFGGPPLLPALLDNMRRSLDINLTSVVRENPRVTFMFVLPPISTLAYIPANSGYLNASVTFRRMLVERLGDLPNVRLFDFAEIRSITDDLSNYKDLIHYTLAINDFMLEAIGHDQYRLSRENLEARVAALTTQVNEFDLCRDGELPTTP